MGVGRDRRGKDRRREERRQLAVVEDERLQVTQGRELQREGVEGVVGEIEGSERWEEERFARKERSQRESRSER